jgi:hypothetical protein
MEKLDIESLTSYIFSDMADVLGRIENCGFPLTNVPPHACGVSLVEDTEGNCTLVRSSPAVLAGIPKDLWIPSTALKLQFDQLKYPEEKLLGVYLGFVAQNGLHEKYYVGLLTTPDFGNVEGRHAQLTQLDKSVAIPSPWDIYPELKSDMYSFGGIHTVH